MTSVVNGLLETLLQRSDFPWRKGALARRTEKIVVGLCLTQLPQQNPYRRVRPMGDEKYPLADDFETLSIRTFLVVRISETKNSRKQRLALRHLVNRLVPENASKRCKVCIKHVSIIIKVAWNIRNYRYAGGVSASPSLVLLVPSR